MKAQKRKNKTYLIVILGAVIILGSVLLAYRQQAWHNSASPTPTPVVPGNSTYDEPSATPTAPVSSAPTPTPAGGGTVAKPTLQKSSGNAPGSSVPAGAIVEFSCEGTAGLGCEVLLTDRSNSARVINLGKKTITSNGRGQSLAIWDWTSVSGSWNVTAKASNTSGTTATSDIQTLEVK